MLQCSKPAWANTRSQPCRGNKTSVVLRKKINTARKSQLSPARRRVVFSRQSSSPPTLGPVVVPAGPAWRIYALTIKKPDRRLRQAEPGCASLLCAACLWLPVADYRGRAQAASARISSGVVRQQPPISRAPWACQWRAASAKACGSAQPCQHLCTGS